MANFDPSDPDPIVELGDDEFVLTPKPKSSFLPWVVAGGATVAAVAIFFSIARPATDREHAATAKATQLQAELDQARAALATAKANEAELQKARDESSKLRDESEKLKDDLAKSTASKAADDKLVDQLKQEVGKGGAEIKGEGERITVTLVDKILFKSGVADLTPEGEAVLAKLATVLKAVDGKTIEVGGHADNQNVESAVKERYPTNWELSAARATNVVRFLQEKGGVKPRRLKAAGYGSTRPVATNSTAAGRAKNRRIEVLLLPEAKIVKGDFADEIAAAEPAAAPAAPASKGKIVPATKTQLHAAAAPHKSSTKKKK